MIISLVYAIHRATSQLHYIGGEFPSCVDIIAIDPPPFSTILQDHFTVTITFSRSISRDIWTKQLSSSRPLIFLSWNSQLTEIKGIKPTSIAPKGSSWRKVECQFSISRQERITYRLYTSKVMHYSLLYIRKLHLVVDGNRFVAMDFAFDKLRQTSVSLSIFGEYYLLESIPDKRSPRDWVPTPFCGSRAPRSLPDPYQYQENANSELKVTTLDNNYLQLSETSKNLNYTVRTLNVMHNNIIILIALPLNRYDWCRNETSYSSSYSQNLI